MANTPTTTLDGHTFLHSFRAGIIGSFWVDDQIGAHLFIDDNSDLAVSRTDDGGATWTVTVLVADTVRPLAFSWAGDRPGDVGSELWLAYYVSSGNDIRFAIYDVNADTFGSAVDISAGPGIGGSLDTIFMTVAQNGDIGVGWVSSTFTISEFWVSTNGGVSWSDTGITPWESHAGDIAWGVWPQTPTSSDHSILFYDLSAGELTIKTYNSGAWTESSAIVTGMATSVSGSHQAIPFDAATRRSDGKTLLAVHSTEQDAATDDLLTFELTIDSVAAPTATAKTNVYTNTANGGVTIEIDHATDDVYVAYVTGYNSVSSAVVYKKSDDGMATWGAETAYSEGSDDYRYLGHGRAGADGGRFQPVFNINAADLYVNLVNDVAFVAPTVTVTLTGTLVPSTTEDAVAAGSPSLTLIATVSGVNWHADIDNDDVESEDFLAALLSSGAEALGWNNVVIGKYYRREVLNDSPLSYWRMGGSFTDLGSVGQNGTATSLTVGGELLLSSAQDSSVFNAGAAKLACSSPAGLDNLWDGGGTAEVVLRPWADGFSTTQSRVFSKIDGGAGWEIGLEAQSGGYVSIFLRVDFSTVQGVWKLTGTLPIGVQSHIAITYDADSASNDPTFYINGIPYTPVETTTPSGTRSSDASSNLFLGSNSSVALTYNGEMQEVALYGTALSATRIQAHVLAASNRYGLRYSNLVRTSASIVTLTMPAFPFFDISAAETITATFPTDVFASAPATPVVASPTFQITPTTRRTNFTPPANPFTPGAQTPGPFGNVNGGLGPAAGDAYRVLGAGDEWALGSPEMAVGLDGASGARVIMIVATEITESV